MIRMIKEPMAGPTSMPIKGVRPRCTPPKNRDADLEDYKSGSSTKCGQGYHPVVGFFCCPDPDKGCTDQYQCEVSTRQ